MWPPDEVVAALASLERPDLAGLRWTSPEQWHVTLRFLGSVDDVVPVTTALGGLSAPATDAALGPEVGRFGRRVLQVPVRGLEAVAADVVDATRSLGRPPEDRPFSGHITLARVRDRARVDLRPLCGVPVSGSWPVRDVCLVESRLHPHGARYEVLERFPLV